MNEHEQVIRDYLTAISRWSWAQHVLDHGRPYLPQSKPRGHGYRFGAERRCFANAYRLAEKHGLPYVEGWAVPAIDGWEHDTFAVHHAWCSDTDGGVIDPTWRTPGLAYIGVLCDLDLVFSTAIENGRWGVLDKLKDLDMLDSTVAAKS